VGLIFGDDRSFPTGRPSNLRSHPGPAPDMCEAWINLNCFEGEEIWVYNTEKQELADLRCKK